MNTHPNFPADASVGELFRSRASDLADQPALVVPGGALSFSELAAAAERVAAAIPESAEPAPVGIMMDYGSAPVAALLGIWMSGQIAMPLDPDYPPELQRELLVAAGAIAVVTDHDDESSIGSHREALPEGLPLIPVDLASTASPAPASTRPMAAVAPDSPAVLIHTFVSASSAIPAGVIVPHRALIANARNDAESTGLAPGDHVALVSRLHTIGAISTIVGGLLNDASLHPFDIRKQNFHEMEVWLQKQCITVFPSAPSVFRRFCESLANKPQFPDLRLIKLSGESVLNYDVKMLQRHFPESCRLLNALHVTELGGDLCHFFIEHDTPPEFDRVPVGEALPGIEILLVDAEGRPVRQGKRGELAFRSGSGSPACWRSPALEDRLIPSPLDDGGGNFLKTGDVARFFPGTGYRHLGCADDRFNFRGYRIHPDAIETLITEHPAVAECFVGEHGSGSQETHLVAWFVPARGKSCSPDDLRSHLRSRLPEPMIPSVFAPVPRLPDAGAEREARLNELPDPFDTSAGADGATSDRPADQAELKLIRMWRKILRRKRVGVKENFYDIGGDSLLAAVLLSRIEAEFAIEFALEDLVTDPTIRGLANAIRNTPSHREFAHLFPVNTSGTKSPFFWAPGAGVHPASAIADSDGDGDDPALLKDHPSYVLRYPGIDGVEEPLRTIEDYAAHFVTHLRKIQPQGPYLLGGGSFGGLVAFEAACQLTAAGQAIELLVIEDTRLDYEALIPRAGLPLGDRIKRRARNLMPLGKRDGFDWQGIKAGFRQFRYRGLVPWKRRTCRRQEKPLPKIYRFHDLINASLRAGDTYRPGSFEGRVALFRNEDHGTMSQWYEIDPTFGWGAFCPRLEIVEISGRHGQRDHDKDLRAEFGEKLKRLLSGELHQ